MTKHHLTFNKSYGHLARDCRRLNMLLRRPSLFLFFPSPENGLLTVMPSSNGSAKLKARKEKAAKLRRCPSPPPKASNKGQQQTATSSRKNPEPSPFSLIEGTHVGLPLPEAPPSQSATVKHGSAHSENYLEEPPPLTDDQRSLIQVGYSMLSHEGKHQAKSYVRASIEEAFGDNKLLELVS